MVFQTKNMHTNKKVASSATVNAKNMFINNSEYIYSHAIRSIAELGQSLGLYKKVYASHPH